MSLSSYLRELIHDETSWPAMGEVLERIATRASIDAGGEQRHRFGQDRYVHAPALIDAEVASAIRGLLLTSNPAIKASPARAQEMLDDFADLPLVRYPMQPHQRPALALRNKLPGPPATAPPSRPGRDPAHHGGSVTGGQRYGRVGHAAWRARIGPQQKV
jgi:predicted nucleic acid-binding protein